MRSAAEVRALEEVAYDVWVAPDVEELDGWRLRAANGITGRANSVWPNGEGAMPLEEKLERVERWYGVRGLPARFQVTDAARPEALEQALIARSYTQPAPAVSVETVELGAPPVPSGRAEVGDDSTSVAARRLYASAGFRPSHQYRYLLR